MSNIKLANVFPPGDFIREELEARGWTQTDLAAILGRPLAAVSQIIMGHRSITAETAKELAEAFGTSADFWMNLDSQYQLSKAEGPQGTVKRRAQMFEKSPIKDMERRHWITATRSPEELETALCSFYRIKSIDEEPALAAAARQSVTSDVLTPEQVAWCFRACRLAEFVQAEPYSPDNFRKLLPKLRAAARYAELIRHIPKALAEAGIRLVLVEHLPKSKMDGAALFTDRGPVIALSMRFDRIDYFWHTLLHELAHIAAGDIGIDPDLSGDMPWSVQPEKERRANEQAAAWLIHPDTLRSFIRRVGPLYSKVRINQFANLNLVHPGIVVGQLQHCREIDWKHNREMLVPVKQHIVGVAITDGWGHLPEGI